MINKSLSEDKAVLDQNAKNEYMKILEKKFKKC